jgi:hypothetical protein
MLQARVRLKTRRLITLEMPSNFTSHLQLPPCSLMCGTSKLKSKRHEAATIPRGQTKIRKQRASSKFGKPAAILNSQKPRGQEFGLQLSPSIEKLLPAPLEVSCAKRELVLKTSKDCRRRNEPKRICSKLKERLFREGGYDAIGRQLADAVVVHVGNKEIAFTVVGNAFRKIE